MKDPPVPPVTQLSEELLGLYVLSLAAGLYAGGPHMKTAAMPGTPPWQSCHSSQPSQFVPHLTQTL